MFTRLLVCPDKDFTKGPSCFCLSNWHWSDALLTTSVRRSKMKRPLRILAVTNMYPSADSPASGTFIEQQIEGLRQTGLNVDVMVVDRLRRGMSCYLGLD